jgi:ABC-type multidrug transport system fused ATPase/permease subunit
VVTLYSSQLVGQVTNAITSAAHGPNAAPQATDAAHGPASAPSAPPTAPANNSAANPAQNPSKAPATETGQKSPITLVILWSVIALVALLIRLPLRALATKLDLAMSNKLRSQLFGRLLRQSPEFYHKHETGELNQVANQMTVEASITLRQVGLDSIIAMITLAINVGALIYNFKMDNPPVVWGMVVPPWLIPMVVTLFAFISPWLTTRMANALRDVSRSMQEGEERRHGRVHGSF